MKTRRSRARAGSAAMTCGERYDPPIPADVRRRGATLLNLQCWCWGWDVRRPEGNLLIERGFSRHRAPKARLGSSAYTLWLDPTRVIVLWGFGCFYGDAALGGLYLSRQGFAPQLAPNAEPPSTVWDFNCLPPMRTPTNADEWRWAYRLLIAAQRWIAEYEEWVITTLGVAYRRECVDAWRKTKLRADEIAGQWRSLSSRLADKLEELTQPEMRHTTMALN